MRGEGGVALPDNGGDAICNSAKNKHTRKMTGNKQNAPLVLPRVACACGVCVCVCVQLKCQKHAQLDRAASHASLRPHALSGSASVLSVCLVVFSYIISLASFMFNCCGNPRPAQLKCAQWDKA